MYPNTYRHDIDCLRCFAVFIVILFHCGFSTFAGGFIGVDIFFVISGYVMSQSVSKDNMRSIGTLAAFYKKRLFRIYPVLLLSLVLTTLFSIFWLGADTFDYFGKQLFFSSISMSNILFAQGQNYFDSKTPILLHTWSLGVEMQFYALFPIFVILLQALEKYKRSIALIFLAFSFIAAVTYAQINVAEKGAFYGLPNRIFEFLIGVIIAKLSFKKAQGSAPPALPIIFIASLVLCAIFFNPKVNHPSLYTLFPVSLTAALILLYSIYDFHKNQIIETFSYLGRISYGIYLFHFPISIFAKDIFSLSAWGILLANIFITLPLAHLSYIYFETPIRRYGYKTLRPFYSIGVILFISTALSASGYIIAKKQGWPERLKFLNPFAYEVSIAHAQSKDHYQRGFHVKKGDHAKILFIGDSVLQQYIDPISSALKVEKKNIDTVTRGGCVLLKGVDFDDVFADISCNELREKLYNIKKNYDYVFISQNWESYKKTILNAPLQGEQYFEPFLHKTILHFSKHTKNLIILGVHPTVSFDSSLPADIKLTLENYETFRNGVKISKEHNIHSKSFFNKTAKELPVRVLHPIDIFCSGKICALKNDNWSYFYDANHLTKFGQNKAKDFFRNELNTGTEKK